MKINVYENQEDIINIVDEINNGKVLLHHHGMMYQWFNNPSLIKTLGIAEIDGQKVGAVIITKQTERECTYNTGVFVVPYHRKKGIGGKLLQSVKNSVDSFRVDSSGFRKSMFKKYLDGKAQ